MGRLCSACISASTYPESAFEQLKNFQNWLMIILLPFLLVETLSKPKSTHVLWLAQQTTSRLYITSVLPTGGEMSCRWRNLGLDTFQAFIFYLHNKISESRHLLRKEFLIGVRPYVRYKICTCWLTCKLSRVDVFPLMCSQRGTESTKCPICEPQTLRQYFTA